MIGQGDVLISSIVNGKLLEGLMRGVLLVRGLGANLYSIGTATDTGIEGFFSNNTVPY